MRLSYPNETTTSIITPFLSDHPVVNIFFLHIVRYVCVRCVVVDVEQSQIMEFLRQDKNGSVWLIDGGKNPM